MIVDVHYHLIPYSMPSERINMMIEEWPMRIAKIMGINVNKEMPRDYEKRTLGQMGKTKPNKANSKPI